MLQAVFLDLDDTLLDFTGAEAAALSQTLRDFGIRPTPQHLERYHAINRRHWAMLEQGLLTRPQVLVQRFETFLREVDMAPSQGMAISRRYEALLCRQHGLLPGAVDLLEALGAKYPLYLASNGTPRVQHPRLDDSGLRPYFQKIFLSEEVGADKPSPAFFDACFAALPGLAREAAVMIGDSLTSDIRGGHDAGLHTVWFDPRRRPPHPEISPDHTVYDLSEIPALLDLIR